jgi:Ca2+-binding EF-hand superfamily protein
MPVTESQAHALAVRFQHWDRDHNGYMEWSDMENAVRRLGEAFGRAEDAHEWGALGSWYNAGESDADAFFRRLDADDDGFLTLDELVRSAGSAFVDDEPVLAAPPPSR